MNRWRSLLIFRLKRRFTRQGIVFFVLLILSGLIGIDTFRTLASQVFSLLAMMFAASLLAIRSFRGDFSAVRHLPRFGTAGESLEYSVVVKNESDRFQKDLILMDGTEYSDVGLHGPAAKRKLITFNRSAGMKLRRATSYDLCEQSLGSLAAGEDRTVKMSLLPERRGYVFLKNLIVGQPDMFHLIKSFFVMKSSQQHVLILPKRYRLPELALPGGRRYQSGGVALTHSVGDSEEFTALRDYRPGDPLRTIHWRSWAKVGKPVVKEYEEEFFVRQALILDTFQTVPDVEVFEEAISLAASFVCTVGSQESLLDLMFIGNEAYCFTSGRGLNSIDRMLEILAAVQPSRDHDFSELRILVQERVASVSGCICIVLEWNEERRRLMTLLKNLGIPHQFYLLRSSRKSRAMTSHVDPAPGDSVRILTAGQLQKELASL